MFDLLCNIDSIRTITSLTLLLVGIFLSCLLLFPQMRNLYNFLEIISSKQAKESTKNTISPLQALLTAISTSLGTGSIAGVPLAIAIGGPGALFWIVAYAFFGSVTKFSEVVFAIKYRTRAVDRSIIGGPTSYLWHVHPLLSYWYGALTLILFAGWSGMQAKTLAEVYSRLGVNEHITGVVMALFVLYMLIGGAKRIGKFSSLLVPIMCSIYLLASLFILLQNLSALGNAIFLIFTKAFTPTAATGGFIGASAIVGMRQGVLKSAFVTESGLGTAAIPHALADTNSAKNQGILAMYSVAIDTFFCIISGLVVLTTGVWQSNQTNNTLIYDAFQRGLPGVGPIILIISITLFAIGTALGNSFNGSKSFGFFTNNKYLKLYYAFVAIIIMLGSVMQTSTLWDIMEFILPLTALPNLIGIVYLSIKFRAELL